VRYIDVIEELSQSKHLHQGDILNFSKEVLKTATQTLACKRANVWLFNQDKTILNSVQSYNADTNSFTQDPSLEKIELPNYFNYLTKNKIIVSNDAIAEEMNKELVDSYLIPNQIKSMIDVPLRSEGKMVGVICFEAVHQIHEWTESDKKFTQSLAQLISIAIETEQKNLYRNELEETIKQKEILLAEINHRVKNNMAVIIGLINLQKHKSKDNYHHKVLEELKEKIYSMAIVQNHLHNNKSLVKVELSQYLTEVIDNLHGSYGYGKQIALQLDLEKAVIDISLGIPIGLIANEVLTNSFKYAFMDDGKSHVLSVSLQRNRNMINLSFKDSGPGIDSSEDNEGMGLELIKDLTKQISGSLEILSRGGVEVRIEFPIDG
jgi:two-component sensor histidine kinase